MTRPSSVVARGALVLLASLAAATEGCSWLVGVSEDPVVVDEPAAADAGAAAADAAADRGGD